MTKEYSALIVPAEEGGFWAICPEVPGANGQGETREETLANLRDAIELVLQEYEQEAQRDLPPNAERAKVAIG